MAIEKHNYAEDEKVAQDFITEFGQAATIVRKTVADDTRPSEPVAGVPLEFPCELAALDAMATFGTSTTLSDDLGKVYVSTLGLTIVLTNTDLIVIDDPVRPYKVEELDVLAPAGYITVYKVKLSR